MFKMHKNFINLFEIERLKNTYGYPCKNDRKYKVIYIEAYGNRLNFGGIKYQYKEEPKEEVKESDDIEAVAKNILLQLSFLHKKIKAWKIHTFIILYFKITCKLR